jgi:hypothetical protein
VRPEWRTSNLDVAVVSASGNLTARHSGEARVACAPGVTTPVTVFEIVGLALDRVNDTLLAVRPLVFSTRDIPADRPLILAPDFVYSCAWDAAECGDAVYENGSCVLALKSPRLCPVESTVKVTGVARSLNVSVNGSVSVVHSNPWGRSDVVVRLPYGNRTTVPLFGNVRKEDVRPADKPPQGIEWDIDDTQSDFIGLRLVATGAYDTATTLTLLDSASREKIRIFISPTGEWDGVGGGQEPTDVWFFYLSIIMTVVLSAYIARKLGAGRLLPPLSPYRQPR